MSNYESLADALHDLSRQGYVADFATDSVCLYCGEFDIRLDPDDFHVDGFYRFEDRSSCDHGVVIYAISSTSGVKGTLVDKDGAYSSNVTCKITAKLLHPQVTALQAYSQNR